MALLLDLAGVINLDVFLALTAWGVSGNGTLPYMI